MGVCMACLGKWGHGRTLYNLLSSVGLLSESHEVPFTSSYTYVILITDTTITIASPGGLRRFVRYNHTLVVSGTSVEYYHCQV